MAQIVWWEIETPEPEAFQRFHTAMWGWTFESAFADTDLGADYWIIRADGRGIGGLQRSATEGRPHAGTRLYLEVLDLEAELQRVQELGGRIERARTELGDDNRWFATAVDPAGIAFGLWTAQPDLRATTIGD